MFGLEPARPGLVPGHLDHVEQADGCALLKPEALVDFGLALCVPTGFVPAETEGPHFRVTGVLDCNLFSERARFSSLPSAPLSRDNGA